jgi:hypothetical protein
LPVVLNSIIAYFGDFRGGCQIKIQIAEAMNNSKCDDTGSLQGKAFLSLRDFKPPLCRAINRFGSI